MNGQILIVSGTSGSGKSTTCERFLQRAPDFWLHYGIDLFLGKSFPARFSHHGPRADEGFRAHPLDEARPDGTLRWSFGPQGWKAIQALHEWIAATSRRGCNIVLDHLMMTDPPVLQDCIWRLQGLPVLLVSLKPPYEVLMERVSTRKMGNQGPAMQLHGDEGVRRTVDRLNRLRPWFYQAVYANDCCDLEIDTVQHDTDQVCTLIEQRLAAGPGTAFETLRRRWLDPR